MSQREEFDVWWEETKPFEVFKEEAWSIWQAATQNRYAPYPPIPPDIADEICRTDWTPKEALQFYADQKHFDVVNGRTRIIDTGAVASNALKHISLEYAEMKGDVALEELKQHQDEIKRLKLDIAKALRAVTNQDALIEATIKLCAQKCTNIATSNGNSDCTKIAADWCGRVILSLVPEDAQRELDELLMKVAVRVSQLYCGRKEWAVGHYDQDDLKTIIEGVKNE